MISKKTISIIFLCGLISGLVLIIIGGIVYNQNAPKLRVICHIEWSGTTGSGYYDEYESGYSEHVVSANADIQTIFDHRSFLFHIRHNQYTNKDPIEAIVIVSMIENIPHVTRYYVKTNYYNELYINELNNPIHKCIPTRITGEGYDNQKTDWRDRWEIKIKECIDPKSEINFIIGQWLFSIGLIFMFVGLIIAIGFIFKNIILINISQGITINFKKYSIYYYLILFICNTCMLLLSSLTFFGILTFVFIAVFLTLIEIIKIKLRNQKEIIERESLRKEIQNLFNKFKKIINDFFENKAITSIDFSDQMEKYFSISKGKSTQQKEQIDEIPIYFLNNKFKLIPIEAILKTQNERGEYDDLISKNTAPSLIKEVLDKFFILIVNYVRDNFKIKINHKK